MRFSFVIALLALALSGCQTPVDVKPITAIGDRWSFAVTGIDTVIVRSRRAKDAEVVESRLGEEIAIHARPQGGAAGYHPSDPSWRETNATDWGMGFTARRYGATLIISSVNEISYIHHDYYLDDIQIVKPPHVRIRLEKRIMDGDDGEGSPDLSR